MSCSSESGTARRDGEPLAKEMSEEYGITPRKAASILDGRRACRETPF